MLLLLWIFRKFLVNVWIKALNGEDEFLEDVLWNRHADGNIECCFSNVCGLFDWRCDYCCFEEPRMHHEQLASAPGSWIVFDALVEEVFGLVCYARPAARAKLQGMILLLHLPVYFVAIDAFEWVFCPEQNVQAYARAERIRSRY